MKNIQLALDEDLFAQVNKTIEQQQITLSAFLKESIIHYLDRLKIKEMERQHREGYGKHPVQEGEFDVWENEQAWVS
ncbi:MAG: CopG family transcriptional regulator [bacterium]